MIEDSKIKLPNIFNKVHLRGIQVNPYVLSMLFSPSEDLHKCISGVPADAKLVGVLTWSTTPDIVFVFEHPSFEAVTEWAPIGDQKLPLTECVFERIYTSRGQDNG